jgi:DNA-binding NtrC family response regulator
MIQELPIESSDVECSNSSICVVYNNPDQIELAIRRLKHFGLTASGTTEPEEVLRKIRFGSCRIVLGDLKMPQMDPFTFLKRAQQIDPGICVIVATSVFLFDSAIATLLDSSTPLPLDKIRRVHIERVLQKCEGNRVKAAHILGIGRTSLYRFLRRNGHNSSAALNALNEPESSLVQTARMGSQHSVASINRTRPPCGR